MNTNGRAKRMATIAIILIAGAFCTLSPARLSAKGREGMRRRETACVGLRGAAFGLCHAYCEAERCDVHPRRSCELLRRIFHRLTGSLVFPCDAFCGDARINQPNEECDPPGSLCLDGQACDPDCSCPPPPCGNGVVDPGEQCDPAGVHCPDGQPCNPNCSCPPPLCGNGTVDPGEQCDPAGPPCADGQPCHPDCTCRGPNPECQQSSCDNFIPCAPAASCAQPVCGTTAEGGGLCVDGDTQCDLLLDCTTSGNCPAGSLCVVNSCCGRAVCVPTLAFCPVP